MEINDELVISLLSDSDGKIQGGKCVKSSLKRLEIYDYLMTRYPDSTSLSETLYRISNKIEIRPTCKCCGKPVKYYTSKKFTLYCSNQCAQKSNETKQHRKDTFLNHYGVDNSFKDPNVREKGKQTMIKKYGVDNSFKSEECKEKAKKTCIERYGTDKPMSSDIVKKRQQETFLRKYGVKCSLQNEEVKAKKIKTIKEKYGVENVSQNEEIKDKIRIGLENTYMKMYNCKSNLCLPETWEKIKKTNKLRYGVEHVSQNKEVFEKMIESKRKNNTFNTSKPEQELYNILILNYADIIKQYKSKCYPYYCDFYIPSLNLYIELNNHWTHGKHPYDENNEDDIKLVEYWKSKNTKFYNIAINTWIVRDIAKREIAKKNKLNYLEIYSTKNLSNIIEFINNTFSTNNLSDVQTVFGKE